MFAALLRVRSFFDYHIVSVTVLAGFALSLFIVWALGEIRLAAFKSDMAGEMALMHHEIEALQADVSRCHHGHVTQEQMRAWTAKLADQNLTALEVPMFP